MSIFHSKKEIRKQYGFTSSIQLIWTQVKNYNIKIGFENSSSLYFLYVISKPCHFFRVKLNQTSFLWICFVCSLELDTIPYFKIFKPFLKKKVPFNFLYVISKPCSSFRVKNKHTSSMASLRLFSCIEHN